MTNSGILSNEFIELVHKKTEQSTERQLDNINNQRIDQDVEDITDIEEINHEDTMELDYYSQHCQNCFRKQHKHLVDNIDSRKYTL